MGQPNIRRHHLHLPSTSTAVIATVSSPSTSTMTSGASSSTTATAPATIAATTAEPVTTTVPHHGHMQPFPSTANNPPFFFQLSQDQARKASSSTRLPEASSAIPPPTSSSCIYPTASSPQSGPARYFASISTTRETSLRIDSGIWPNKSIFGSFHTVLLLCVQGYPYPRTASDRQNRQYTSLGAISSFSQHPNLVIPSRQAAMLHQHSSTQKLGCSYRVFLIDFGKVLHLNFLL